MDTLNYKQSISPIDTISKLINVGKNNEIIQQMFSQNIFKNCYIEYLGLTLTAKKIKDIKLYIKPNNKANPLTILKNINIYNYNIINIIQVIMNKPNIEILDMSFQFSIESRRLTNYRFTFKINASDKEQAKQSISFILKTTGLCNCKNMIDKVITAIENQLNINRYPVYIIGFEYNLNKNDIDLLKVYFLGEKIIKNTICCRNHFNEQIKNIITRSNQVIKLDSHWIQLYDEIIDIGFNILLLGINIRRNSETEFKLYFEIDKMKYNADKYLEFLAKNTFICKNYLTKLMNTIYTEFYKLKGLALGFSDKPSIDIKLYFKPFL